MRACFALVLLLCTGCTLLAGKADYADYREVRLAGNLQSRALAMQRYVAKHPNGHWHEEIQGARASQDLAAFEAGKDTRPGLEHYLQAYPDGAFAAQARGRLSAVALIEKRNQLTQRQNQELVDARKQRTEELRRTWIARFIGYWTTTLASVHNWGEPIAAVAQANPQFSRAFAAQPRPRCTQDECLKYYTSQYGIPVPGGTRLERTLSLVLRLRLRAGKLERAELLLPERGFSRWYELENRRPVAQGDAEARAAATQWALERLAPLIAAIGSDLTQSAEAHAPTIERPAIGPTGELTDTSIEAPSDPQNRVSGDADNAGIGANVPTASAPTVAELVKPDEQPAADMVFTPLGISKQGQRVATAPAPAAAPAAEGGEAGPGQAAGEVMVLDAVAVPKGEGAPTTVPAASTPAAPTPEVAAPSAGASTTTIARADVVRGFHWHGLHIVAFAAGLDNASPYDGVIIEQAAAARATPHGKIGTSKTPPRAH